MMVFIDFEWVKFYNKELGYDFKHRYECFSPDLWFNPEEGTWGGAILDKDADYQNEIIDVRIIPKHEVRFMWE